eukprot:1160766-Pelagomonas_calceolata.AAC.9
MAPSINFMTCSSEQEPWGADKHKTPRAARMSLVASLVFGASAPYALLTIQSSTAYVTSFRERGSSTASPIYTPHYPAVFARV